MKPILDARLQALPEIRLRVGQGIAGWVAENDQPAIVNDAYMDDRFYSEIDKLSGFKTRSILCVPLHIEQKVTGILEAINKEQGAFDDNDLRLLQSITGPLAVAIQNARLHHNVLAEKRRVETIFSSMSEGMLTANRYGVITASNVALHKLLDDINTVLIGRPVPEVIRTLQPGFQRFIDEVVASGNEFSQLICDVEKMSGGHVPVIISCASIDHGIGEDRELVLVFSDLTQIREIERMRDDFFNNIVHELHTPLATILMYARLLRKGKAEDDPSKANRFLKVIEEESDRLQRLVRQMLTLAKIQATDVMASDESAFPNTVFKQLIPPLSDRAEAKGLAFVDLIEPDLPAVQGSEETLYMIFTNLIENAIKFSPTGRVTIDADFDGERVRVKIADEGIGISPEGLPNLFSRFYRAQTAVEKGIAGTGLGLYMVKEGLDRCGGAIEVSSEVGQGTTFVVYLVPATA